MKIVQNTENILANLNGRELGVFQQLFSSLTYKINFYVCWVKNRPSVSKIVKKYNKITLKQKKIIKYMNFHI